MVSPSLTLLRTQSDDRLVALARTGHERAFDAIVERYRRPLLRHARRLIASEARAEEAVQQALLAAWAALGRGDEVRHLSGWLHRIVHNAALNALRGERDDSAELREWLEGASGPEDELERRELLRATLANLAALPDRQREALLRIAVDGASAEDVGSSLGLTEGAVRQLLYRARTAMRAAATALTPMPVAGWIARAEPLADRLAEAVGGAGSAGIGSILAKTGVVAVVAGAAAAGPVVLDHRAPDRARADREVAERPAPARHGGTVSAASRLTTTSARPVASGSSRRASSGPGDGSSRRDSSGPGDGSSRGDSSGPGSGSSSGDSSGSGDSGSSGSSESGSSGSGESGSSASSGSGSSGSSGSGSSGSGSGSSGSGSGSSGSGTLGTGSGSSGSSGSGISGSGSGSSGSGTSGSGTLVSGIGSSGSGSSGSGSGSSGSGSDDPTDD